MRRNTVQLAVVMARVIINVVIIITILILIMIIITIIMTIMVVMKITHRHHTITIIAIVITPPPSVHLRHDQDDEGRPTGERMRSQSSTASVVILLPKVTGAMVTPEQRPQQVRPKLRVDPAGFLPAIPGSYITAEHVQQRETHSSSCHRDGGYLEPSVDTHRVAHEST